MKHLPDALALLAIAVMHILVVTALVAFVQRVAQCLTLDNLIVWAGGLSAPGVLLLLVLYVRGARREREDLAPVWPCAKFRNPRV